MDRIQQRIIEIAQQIPEYVGYQAKERRREADKLVRRQLAAKYDEQRTRLTRLARQAPLEIVVDLENLDQKLQRLIARLKTAPGGYAGWFDAAQIVEGDLDQMTQFDVNLTEGVAAFSAALDRIASTLKSKKGLTDAIWACAELLDSLNALFDQREQFLAMGKKPSLLPDLPPVSPLQALEAKKAPPAEITRLSSLKLQDAVSYGDVDYLVAGKMTYATGQGAFWACLLRDGKEERWLRVGPGNEVVISRKVDYAVPRPFPESIEFENQTMSRENAGTANITVEGAGGVKRGSVEYARYADASGSRLWVEDFGTETRTSWGQVVDPTDLKTYRR
jgi:hypothetical protein